MKPKTIIISILLLSMVMAYTPPNNENVVIVLPDVDYTPPSNENVKITLGVASGAPPADSCTYSSGNWNIDCSDNCVLSTNTDVGGNTVIMSGTGTVTINADITDCNYKIIGTDASNTCRYKIENGKLCGN